MKSHGLAKQFPASSNGEGNSVVGISKNERTNDTQFGRVFIDDNSHDQSNQPHTSMNQPPIINNEVAVSMERHINNL